MQRLGLAGLVLIVLTHAVRGQTAQAVSDGSIDVGGAWLRQPGLAATDVVTAAAQFRYTTPTFALSTYGIGARTPEQRFTGQGILAASRYAPPEQRLRWELSGSASAFGVSNASPAFAWQALAREHLGWSSGGVFLGATGGQVAQSGASRGIAGAHTGLFTRLDPLGRDELSTALAYTDVGVAVETRSRIRYGDAVGYWTHRVPRLELTAGGGLRVASFRSSSALSWASANASVWMTERAAIVLAAGRALADEARGVPSVRYFSISVRIGSRAGLSPATLFVRREHPGGDDGGRLDVRADADSLRVVTVRLSRAAGVEIMADFTDWEPVPLLRMPNGEWSITRAISPGTHRIAMRVSGGGWMVPPNLPRVADDFGGEVGIVIVP